MGISTGFYTILLPWLSFFLLLASMTLSFSSCWYLEMPSLSSTTFSLDSSMFCLSSQPPASSKQRKDPLTKVLVTFSSAIIINVIYKPQQSSVIFGMKQSDHLIKILVNIIILMMAHHKDHHVLSYHSQLSRYDHEEGFSDEEKQPQIVITRNQQTYESVNILQKKRTRARVHEPKIKLKYILNQQPTRASLHNSIADREFQSRSSVSKSLQFHKKQPHKSMATLQPILKSKRTLIGENLSIPTYAMQDLRVLKQNLLADGHALVFEASKEVNTHGHLKKIGQYAHEGNFLLSRFNSLLRQRLKDSFILPKKKAEDSRSNQSKLVFNSEIESGNLELVTQTSQSEFHLYLRIDTNTHGHQNWFHFEVSNPHESGTFVFHICNLKRDFKLFEKGQKIFVKQVRKDEKWQPSGSNISIVENTNPKIAGGRTFKLSFSLHLKENTKYAVSMLPAYTYSTALSFIENLEDSNRRCVEVDLLGYSLTGLAIPVVSITNKETKNEGKKVVLLSCRVHPGETISSIVVEGLMRRLVDESDKSMVQMLKTTVFKIVPVLNPDGVVFGNFRTNYLGIDLNRAFYSDDEVLNPQIWALKSLGRELKSQFGNNFALFIDLHGHSSQKNIFSYGPNFDYNDPNFYVARLLPKVLGMKSKYFKYSCCTFKLEEHKLHTARGFFLNELKVMTYTIESSYSMYDDLDGASKLMRPDDWANFGFDLAEAIETSFRIKQANTIRSNRELRNILNVSENEEQLIKKIKSEVKKEMKGKLRGDDKNNNQDSDGESSCQDLTEEERKEAEKKVLQFNFPLSLPKVLKPAILYPTVTPKLFEVNEDRDEGNFKILYTKRSKYNTLRMMNANSMYANYLRNLDQLEKFKPSARNIKLEKKFQL